MHNADIIEMFSDAPSLPQPVRSSKFQAARNKGKGKMKEPQVIELIDNSDSESEVQLLRDMDMSTKWRRGSSQTPGAGSSKAMLKGNRQIIVDEDLDVEDFAAPKTHASSSAEDSRVEDSRAPRNFKHRLPANEEFKILDSSTSALDGRNSNTRVTQFAGTTHQ